MNHFKVASATIWPLALALAVAARMQMPRVLETGGATVLETLMRWSPLRCPLRTLIGIQCPTCGLGRAFAALIQGDWLRSWELHPLALIAASSFAVLTILAWIQPSTFHSVQVFAARVRQRFPTPMLLLIAALSIIWGAFREIP